MKDEKNEKRTTLPYNLYKEKGNKDRKLQKNNSFKNKIYALIKSSKQESIELNKTLKIMFLINHLEAHVPWLMERIEEEKNYYKTIQNINKCKNRALNELLYTTNVMTIKLNKRGKQDKRLWLAVFEVEYKELRIVCVTKFTEVEGFLGRLAMEETDIEQSSTMLINAEGEKRVLDKPMYFTYTLKQALDKTDEEIQKLLIYNSLYKNNKENK
jgi:hypothetical protein